MSIEIEVARFASLRYTLLRTGLIAEHRIAEYMDRFPALETLWRSRKVRNADIGKWVDRSGGFREEESTLENFSPPEARFPRRSR